MSNTLREYGTISHTGLDEGRIMSITATVQKHFGGAVQFTIGGEYCVLAENQIKDLIDALTKRLKYEKGYSATDWEDCIMVNPEKMLEFIKEDNPKDICECGFNRESHKKGLVNNWFNGTSCKKFVSTGLIEEVKK